MSEWHVPIFQDLLPGPVTVLLKRMPALSLALNPENPLIGIRIPDHQFIRNVVRLVGSPLALTSANLSGGKSAIAVEVRFLTVVALFLIIQYCCISLEDVYVIFLLILS